MYFQVTGTAKLNGYFLSNDDTRIESKIAIDRIVEATTEEKAKNKALTQAIVEDCYKQNYVYVPTEQEWESTPDVTIVPPDKVNRLLGLEVAPTLPGLE